MIGCCRDNARAYANLFKSTEEKKSIVAMITVLFIMTTSTDIYVSKVLWPIAHSTNKTSDFAIASIVTSGLTFVAIFFFGALVFNVYVFCKKGGKESPLLPKVYETV